MSEFYLENYWPRTIILLNAFPDILNIVVRGKYTTRYSGIMGRSLSGNQPNQEERWQNRKLRER